MSREKSSQAGLYLQEIDNVEKPGNLVVQSLSMLLLAPWEHFSSARPKICGGIAAEEPDHNTGGKISAASYWEGGLRLWVFGSTREHLRHREIFSLWKPVSSLKIGTGRFLATENWSLKTLVITGDGEIPCGTCCIVFCFTCACGDYCCFLLWWFLCG